jgi:N-acetylmuramoyl-L-alanine amidase
MMVEHSREIDHIVIHCAATKAKMDIGADEIRQWHKDKGWNDIGYHYVIRRNGEVEKGRDESIPGAHVAGHNKHTLGICLVGGLDDEGHPEPNFTDEQMLSLRDLVNQLRLKYALVNEAIVGHRDFPGVSKACPCFDVRKWWLTNEVLMYG